MNLSQKQIEALNRMIEIEKEKHNLILNLLPKFYTLEKENDTKPLPII